MNNEWIQKRAHAIINYYGEYFFKNRTVLDIGTGHGKFALMMADLGAIVTCVDYRKNYLDLIKSANPNIKCIKADLDQEWPFGGQMFDLTLHMGTLNHLMDVEKNIANVCAVTNHLVLDTQLCDSFNQNKIISIKERVEATKSVNGRGARPSRAFVETRLSNAGMQYERKQDAECNSGIYKYDWVDRGSDSYKDGLSGLWFARRHTLAPVISIAPQASRFPPNAPSRLSQTLLGPVVYDTFKIPPAVEAISIPINYKFSADNDLVKAQTRECALINYENFIHETTFTTSGTILPISESSKKWFQKIAPLFPKLNLHSGAHTMKGFNKTNAEPDVVMCSVDAMIPCKKIWIEEWCNYTLTAENVALLKDCKTIMTPSLVNAQEILSALPDANVVRVARPWPSLRMAPTKSSNFIYLEKSPALTKLLYDSWLQNYGKLTVVGTLKSLPSFAEYMSDCDSFSELTAAMYNSCCLIDLSGNDYYMSGSVALAESMNLPVITNNNYKSYSNNNIIIERDNNLNYANNVSFVRKAINEFLTKKPGAVKYDDQHNVSVNMAVKQMIGV